jgi:energy-coupling factor transport system permease protein
LAIEQILGQYYAAASPLHRLDARVKLTLLVVEVVAAFAAHTFVDLARLQLLLFFAAVVSRIPLRAQLKAAAPLLVVGLFPMVFNLLFISGGTELVHAGPLIITTEGLQQGLYLTWRLLLLLYFSILMVLSTTSVALCNAVAAMLRPFERFGLPAFEIAMMATIALRFVPTLAADVQHIRNAQVARGANSAPGGLWARVKAVGNLLVPLFTLAIQHASDLADAMEARCYRGGQNRGSYRLHQFGAREIVAICLVTVELVCVIMI